MVSELMMNWKGSGRVPVRIGDLRAEVDWDSTPPPPGPGVWAI
jgi:hypothetical protein